MRKTFLVAASSLVVGLVMGVGVLAVVTPSQAVSKGRSICVDSSTKELKLRKSCKQNESFFASASVLKQGGKSAYETWLELGNSGSKQDFIKSLVGSAGARGSQGLPGPSGPPGNIGPSGDSAYDVAVANGFEGTEIEWLESLSGAPEAKVGRYSAPGSEVILYKNPTLKSSEMTISEIEEYRIFGITNPLEVGWYEVKAIGSIYATEEQSSGEYEYWCGLAPDGRFFLGEAPVSFVLIDSSGGSSGPSLEATQGEFRSSLEYDFLPGRIKDFAFSGYFRVWDENTGDSFGFDPSSIATLSLYCSSSWPGDWTSRPKVWGFSISVRPVDYPFQFKGFLY